MLEPRWLGDCKVVPFDQRLFESFWASISQASVDGIILGWERDKDPKECVSCLGEDPEYARAYEFEGVVSIISICEECHRVKESDNSLTSLPPKESGTGSPPQFLLALRE